MSISLEDSVRSTTRTFVERWRPRMGIAELVHVETIDDDGTSERQLEAKCVPLERDAAGLWSFTMQVVAIPDMSVADLEKVVVHELVHVLLEPLRATYLGAKAAWLLTTRDPSKIVADNMTLQHVGGSISGKIIVMPPESDLKEVISAPSLEAWETVIDRIAHAFLAAYAVDVTEAVAADT